MRIQSYVSYILSVLYFCVSAVSLCSLACLFCSGVDQVFSFNFPAGCVSFVGYFFIFKFVSHFGGLRSGGFLSVINVTRLIFFLVSYLAILWQVCLFVLSFVISINLLILVNHFFYYYLRNFLGFLSVINVTRLFFFLVSYLAILWQVCLFVLSFLISTNLII